MTKITQGELNAMTNSQLQGLMNKVQKTLNSRSPDAKKAKALEDIAKVAKRHGFKVDELLSPDGGAKATRRRRKGSTAGTKLPPKYRDPNNHENLWAGRGRKPGWVVEHLEQGLPIEDLLISNQP